jgi:hypothetical protein
MVLPLIAAIDYKPSVAASFTRRTIAPMTQQRPATLWLGGKDFAVFVLYVLTVCVAVFYYLPWVDEARGWMIARDYDVCPLIFRALRYEGHPALWYLLLWLPAHLHMPYVLINWLSAAIASIGIYIFLRYSPFSFYLRALIPFGFFLGFQYAVVARSYVLFPLLGFTAAHLYRQRSSNPIAMAAVLSLLANVSIHGTIVAIGLAVLYAAKLAKEFQPATWPPQRRRQTILGAALFTSSIVFVAVCLWPAIDMSPPFSPTVAKLVRRVIVPIHATRPYHPHGRAGLFMDFRGQAPAALTDPAPSRPAPGSPKRPLLHRLAIVLGYPVATFYPLAFSFEALVVIYLFRNAKIALLLPAVMLVLFMTLFLAQLWHVGLFWVTLLLVLWIAWDNSSDNSSIADAWHLQRTVSISLALLCILQLPWTLGAIHNEMHHPTDPAKAAANYLKSLPSTTRIDALGLGFSVLPYFKGNLFLDQSRRPLDRHEIYTATDCTYCVDEVLGAHPDLILADSKTLRADDWAIITAAGYRSTRSFCGGMYFPHWPMPPECLLVLQMPQAR